MIEVTELKKGDFFHYKDHGLEVEGFFEYYLSNQSSFAGISSSLYLVRFTTVSGEKQDMTCIHEFPGEFDLLNSSEDLRLRFPNKLEQYLTHPCSYVREWAKKELQKD